MTYSETDAVRIRYDRRKAAVEPDRYSPLNPSVWQSMHERQRAMLQFFARRGILNFAETKLLEVGCGTGGNLLEFLRLGFQPENLTGIELLEDRVAQANKVLPGMGQTGRRRPLV
ncbi:MAG: class I SAM-dependent methyltransferase [Chlorobium sp.]|nr:class I SAM-dependent methyltransferase [Chlorobium sp.]